MHFPLLPFSSFHNAIYNLHKLQVCLKKYICITKTFECCVGIAHTNIAMICEVMSLGNEVKLIQEFVMCTVCSRTQNKNQPKDYQE